MVMRPGGPGLVPEGGLAAEWVVVLVLFAAGVYLFWQHVAIPDDATLLLSKMSSLYKYEKRQSHCMDAFHFTLYCSFSRLAL